MSGEIIYSEEPVTIRKATAADTELLVRLRLDYLMADRGKLTETERQMICAQLREFYPKHVGHGFVAILAEVEQKTVAAAFLVISERPANPSFFTGKTATLLNVFTYPAYRRRGIAGKILTEMIAEAKRLNVSIINLLATAEGKSLYEKLGFSEPDSTYTAMKLNLQ